MDALLSELGNHGHIIPYYAVFQPKQEPVHFDGVFYSPDLFLEKAGLVGDSGGQTPVSGEEQKAPAVEPAAQGGLAEGFEPILTLPPAG